MLTIYTAHAFMPEKTYVFQVLFREILGAEFQIIADDSAQDYRICLPNDAELHVENHFFKPNAAFEALKPENIVGAVPHPFKTGADIIGIYGRADFKVSPLRIDCGLDIFADTFFMLSRWEEAAPESLDQHGRFPAEKSLAYQAGFLQRPVVNEWADLLWEMLQQLGWQHTRPKRTYRLLLSCDVDHPRLWWSFLDRFKTLGGAIFKRGDLSETLYFIENHLFNKKDPYDIFDEWLALFEKNKLTAQFNFLGTRPRNSNCWYPLEHPFVLNLMEKLAARGHNIGFHPSYEAFEEEAVFKRELASLQALSPVEIRSGRQHYLRFKAPDTWRMWQTAGMALDSTLGYPEAAGFRCGICYDFPVFDRDTRAVLSLREQPLIAMDVTLAQYQKQTPEQAAEQLQQLRREVEKHGGDFTLLWHNSSWNTPFWEPWKKVLIGFVSGY